MPDMARSGGDSGRGGRAGHGYMPADRFPEFWEWMGRVDKLRDQLLEC